MAAREGSSSSTSDEDDDELFPHVLRVHIISARGLDEPAPLFGRGPFVMAVLGDEQRETACAVVDAAGATPAWGSPRAGEAAWGDAACEGEVLEFDFDARSAEVLSLQV